MLRSEADPNMPIDWEGFEAVDRTAAQFEAVDAVRIILIIPFLQEKS